MGEPIQHSVPLNRTAQSIGLARAASILECREVKFRYPGELEQIWMEMVSRFAYFKARRNIKGIEY